MKLKDHAKHTQELFGHKAIDIHQWIDGMFDHDNFEHFVRTGHQLSGKDLYSHRQFRHCIEALDLAYEEFEGQYTKEQIKNIFKTHLRDDYQGHLPCREDFLNGTFEMQYHEKDSSDSDVFSLSENQHYLKSQKNKMNQSPFFNFTLKFILPTALSLIFFILALSFIIMPLVEKNLINQKIIMTEELTKTAIGIAQHFIKLQETGIIDEQEAKLKTIEMIRQLRYGPQLKDYFWITDTQPFMIMHPYRPDLEGKDLNHYKVEGQGGDFDLFVEFVKLVKTQGEGHQKYRWQWKDDSSQMASKISYVKGIPKWGWIIGTGVYLNDIERELEQIDNKILKILAFIIVILMLVTTYILYQSYQTEMGKALAQERMIEAKERYRALVEQSSEGQILFLDNVVVYANHAIQRLLGYEEFEITATTLTNEMLTNLDDNDLAEELFHDLLHGNISSQEVSGQLRTKHGQTLEVLITTSKIFLSGKKGALVKIRPIWRSKDFPFSNVHQNMENQRILSSALSENMPQCQTVGEVIIELNRVPLLVNDLLQTGTNAHHLRSAVSRIFNSAISRLIELVVFKEDRPVPCQFAFMNLGSNARQEMTMFSDQDNALIFEDMPPSMVEKTRKFFLELSQQVCNTLQKAGHPYCPGGIMAVNPKCCLTLSEWKKNFSKWISSSSPESILDVNVFFDIALAHGHNELVSQLRAHIREELQRHPSFFIHYAKNCLLYRPALNLFGQLTGRNDTINLKEAIIPLVLFAKIYALKYDIVEANTLKRLKVLTERNIITSATYNEISFVFDHLWMLRFENQLFLHSQLRKVSDHFELKRLTDIERQILKTVLGKITHFQTMLSYDFLGTPLG